MIPLSLPSPHYQVLFQTVSSLSASGLNACANEKRPGAQKRPVLPHNNQLGYPTYRRESRSLLTGNA